ncbi:MAG TPA: hypothetical protein VK604_19390 [Bryobacteraceae bacterium]|nr:hypothetical protein [Bryobacteraceae bacterium]
MANVAGDVTGLVEQVHHMGPLPQAWQAIVRRSEADRVPNASLHVARYLLLTKIVSFSLDSARALPVPLEVQYFLYDEFSFIAEPVQNSLDCFEQGSYALASLCHEACLQRFPAGQLHVMESGFSRRWFLNVPPREVLPIAWHVFVRMGGHQPYYVPHNAHRKKFSLMFLEKEQRRSMVRIAQMLELNSHVRGLMATGWLHSPNLGEASPHLKWMMQINRELIALGAAFTTMGPAPEDSGFLVGDKRRISLYRSGQWKPLEGLLIAPREAMIQWARQQTL